MSQKEPVTWVVQFNTEAQVWNIYLSWVTRLVHCIQDHQPWLRLGYRPSPWCSCSLCCPWDKQRGEYVNFNYRFIAWSYLDYSHDNNIMFMKECITSFSTGGDVPVEPCSAEAQTPGWAPSLWTSSLHTCSGLQPKTLHRYYPGNKESSM